jgi:hypothetical protein
LSEFASISEVVKHELLDRLPGEKQQKLADYSGFAIADVVKKFFTKLLVPVVPYSIYTSILGMLEQ